MGDLRMSLVKEGNILKHCKGSVVLIIGTIQQDTVLYAKNSESDFQKFDLWIRPIGMFDDVHSSGVPRFELIDNLKDDEFDEINRFRNEMKYAIARDSETLEYIVVNLVRMNIDTLLDRK